MYGLLCCIVVMMIFSQVPEINGIVNGFEAHDGQFKYVASIRDDFGQMCSGSIIDEKHILTVAHCVFEPPIDVIKVVVGRVNLENLPESALLSVDGVAGHPDFEDYVDSKGNEYTLHDIAILRLSNPLTWSPTVAPIGLLEPAYIYSGASCDMSGWGWLSPNVKVMSNKLMWTTAKVADAVQCHAANVDLQEGELCAFNNDGHTITSPGDSGGIVACDGRGFAVVIGGHNFPQTEYTIIRLLKPYLEFIDDAVHGRVEFETC